MAALMIIAVWFLYSAQKTRYLEIYVNKQARHTGIGLTRLKSTGSRFNRYLTIIVPILYLLTIFVLCGLYMTKLCRLMSHRAA